MVSDWLDPFDDIPDWHDMGKQVEAETTDGAHVIGELEYYDMTPGPNENPLFHLVVEGRKLNWFDDVAKFRYINK